MGRYEILIVNENVDFADILRLCQQSSYNIVKTSMAIDGITKNKFYEFVGGVLPDLHTTKDFQSYEEYVNLVKCDRRRDLERILEVRSKDSYCIEWEEYKRQSNQLHIEINALTNTSKTEQEINAVRMSKEYKALQKQLVSIKNKYEYIIKADSIDFYKKQVENYEEFDLIRLWFEKFRIFLKDLVRQFGSVGLFACYDNGEYRNNIKNKKNVSIEQLSIEHLIFLEDNTLLTIGTIHKDTRGLVLLG